jgi:hypothetical protein
MEISRGSSAAKTPGKRTNQGFPPRQGRRRRWVDLLHPAAAGTVLSLATKIPTPIPLVMTSNP